jgi:hypothetical protein
MSSDKKEIISNFSKSSHVLEETRNDFAKTVL